MNENEPTERQTVAERMTVGLIPKVVGDLAHLVALTGLSSASCINRAVTLYAFVAEQLARGNDLLVRDNTTGEVEKVYLI